MFTCESLPGAGVMHLCLVKIIVNFTVMYDILLTLWIFKN